MLSEGDVTLVLQTPDHHRFCRFHRFAKLCSGLMLLILIHVANNWLKVFQLDGLHTEEGGVFEF